MTTLKELEAKQTLGDKLVVMLKDINTGEEVELIMNPQFAIEVQNESS